MSEITFKSSLIKTVCNRTSIAKIYGLVHKFQQRENPNKYHNPEKFLLESYRNICIGGQLASASASLGARRLFRELELPCLRDGQNGFLSMLGMRRRVFLVSRTTVAAMNAPPPTRAPQARPTETLRDEFLFFLEDGGVSVL